MAYEIERKFLVQSTSYKDEARCCFRIVQGYLCSNPERTVRVRIKGEKAYLTIKGAGNISGTTRFEWEKEITVKDAEELMLLCEPGVVDKCRYEVAVGSHIFEVDEFYGDNQGLVVAEVELESEADSFEKPSWLGAEVTGDRRYYNSSLVKKPYRLW